MTVTRRHAHLAQKQVEADYVGANCQLPSYIPISPSFTRFPSATRRRGMSECSALSGLVPRLILPEASLCGSLAWSLACWHQGGPRASATRQGAGANCALTMSPRPSQGPVRFGLGCPWMRGIPFGSLSNKPAPSGGGTWQEPRRCRRDRRRKNNSDTQKIR